MFLINVAYSSSTFISGHSYPEERRPNEQQTQHIQDLSKLMVPATSIQGLFQEKYRLNMQPQDIHNVAGKIKKKEAAGRTETQILRDTLQALSDNDPGSTVSIVEHSGCIEVILFQTSLMKEYLTQFPDMLFIDATYCVNRNNMPLFVFLVPDADSKGQVVAYGIVKDERSGTLRKLFAEFERLNDLGETLKTIVVDKDLNEISQLKEVYSHADILLCRFHVLKAMKSGIASHCKPNETESVRTELSKMVYSADQKTYDDCLSEIRKKSPDFASYFDSAWQPLRESWAGYAIMGLVHRGFFTNNFVESHNRRIKSVAQRSSTISSLISSLLQMQITKRSVNIQKSSSMVLKVPSIPKTAPFRDMEVINAVFEEASNRVAHKILVQLNKAHLNDYRVLSVDVDPVQVVNTKTESSYDVSSLTKCSCAAFLINSLPCAHVFFARKVAGIPLFIPGMVPDHCKRSHLLEVHQSEPDPNRPAVQHVSSCNQPTEHQKVLSSREKYRLGHEQCKILCGTMANCSTAVFHQRMGVLEELNGIWLSGENVDAAELLSGKSAETVQVELAIVDGSELLSGEIALSEQVENVDPAELMSGESAPSVEVDHDVGGSVCDNGGDIDSAAIVPIDNDSSQPDVVERMTDKDNGCSDKVSNPVSMDVDHVDSVAPGEGSSSQIDASVSPLSDLTNMSLPAPVKSRGRPKGSALTVIGTRKRKGGKGPQAVKRSKRK